MINLTNKEVMKILNHDLNKYMAKPGLMNRTVAVNMAEELFHRSRFESRVNVCVLSGIEEYERAREGKR